MRRLRHRGTAALAVIGVLAILAGCTKAAAPGSPAQTGKPVRGGDVTFAETPGTPPNYIFPMDALQYFSTNNINQFQYLMWRPLYWIGQGSDVTLNASLSLAQPPVYSHGNTVVTLRLKPGKWSDGKPVTSRDVVFWINLLKANKLNWGEYAPGFFPDDVTKVAAPSASQVVLTLNGPVSQQWFTQSELSQITPLPQHAWDKTSASGAVGNYDTSTAGAKAVYKFLDAQARQLRRYDSNPLWHVVDGPWQLTAFNPSGQARFTPNKSYSGPVKPQVASFTEVPFTSEAAEYSALRAGQLTYGYIPATDIAQKSLLQRQGFQVQPWYMWSMNIVPINFNNPAVGPMFRQLYVRAALQSLIDQKHYISAILKGYGAVENGPVPTLPSTRYLTPQLRSGPYSYSVSRAKSLLSRHGWTIRPNGVSTCARPGTGAAQCGAGIARGAQLSFTIAYAAGVTAISQEMQAWKSALSLVGIRLILAEQPASNIFSTMAPCSPHSAACKWQMSYWGTGWEFAPDYYPSGEVAFQTGAIGNWGSYSNSQMDSKIKATTTQSGLSVFRDWADYTTQQLPMLFMPLASTQISAIRGNLSGAVPQSPAGLAITPENWYFRGHA